MALDTADKRASALHVGLPFRSTFPVADGALDQADRQHAAGWYRGILAAVATAPTVFGDLTTLFVAYVQDLRDASALSRLDSPSLVMKDVGTVRAATNSPDDYNTALAEYLS
jgi:hypothetical protein